MSKQGTKTTAQDADALKKKLDELEALAENLLGSQKKTWEAAAARIPKKLRGEFTFPEGEGELTTDQLLANTAKFDEYVRLGLIEAGGAGGRPGNGRGEGNEEPAPNPRDLPLSKLKGMSAEAKMEAGYDLHAGQPRKRLSEADLETLTPAAKLEAGYAEHQPWGGAEPYPESEMAKGYGTNVRDKRRPANKKYGEDLKKPEDDNAA